MANNYFMNHEKYHDSTAGRALANCAKQERKTRMAKKNSKKSQDELLWHEEAVRWRKKTDQQFHEDLKEEKARQYAYGYNKGRKDGQKDAPSAPAVDLEALKEKLKCIPRVGDATADKIIELIKTEF